MTVSDEDLEVLLSGPLETVRRSLSSLSGLKELARSAHDALHGDLRAVDLYVACYRELTRNLVDAAARIRPNLIVIHRTGSVEIDDHAGHQAGFISAALDESAADMPFTRWAAALGLGEGAAAHALASLRQMLPDTTPLTPPATGGILPISELAARRFLRAVRISLNAAEPPLERIQQVFDLNMTELGALFGVSRQAVPPWLDRGVPSNRQDKVATVAAVADLLERKLKTERIPGIARRPADAYSGKSMLQLIAEDRHQELLELTRQSFDWATAA